jgi:hypothetical protein
MENGRSPKKPKNYLLEITSLKLILKNYKNTYLCKDSKNK